MSTTNNNVAAIAQLRSTGNKLENLINIAECARLSNQQDAKMLFLPECFGFIGESSEQTLANAEEGTIDSNNEANDPAVTNYLQSACLEKPSEPIPQQYFEAQISVLRGLGTIARASQLWISGGGIHLGGAPPNEDGKPWVYNTHIILDSNGSLVTKYCKIHLFDVSIPGKVQLEESATTAPGTELVVCDSPLGKLGLSTCYDVRFPEMYISLVNQGAQILLVPSAFTVPTGTAHWHTLLKARAIESQCYVLAAAQFGRHNHKRESFGHTLAVNPWGEVVADAGGSMSETPPETPSVVTCDIDLKSIDSVRQRMPLAIHRSNAWFG